MRHTQPAKKEILLMMELPEKLKSKEVHRIDDTRRAILNGDNKMLAFGQQAGDNINWTWIKKSEQD
jgi:hypothetical protein